LAGRFEGRKERAALVQDDDKVGKALFRPRRIREAVENPQAAAQQLHDSGQTITFSAT